MISSFLSEAKIVGKKYVSWVDGVMRVTCNMLHTRRYMLHVTHALHVTWYTRAPSLLLASATPGSL